MYSLLLGTSKGIPIVQGEWLSLVKQYVVDGVTYVIVNAHPTDFCAIPPGLLFALAPYSPTVEVKSLGSGNWEFSLFPNGNFTLQAAYVNMCGEGHLSNQIAFNVGGSLVDKAQ